MAPTPARSGFVTGAADDRHRRTPPGPGTRQVGSPRGLSTMRRTTSIVTASIVTAFLAGIVLAACGSRQPSQPTTDAVATGASATTVAPATTASPARTATTQQADARDAESGAP